MRVGTMKLIRVNNWLMRDNVVDNSLGLLSRFGSYCVMSRENVTGGDKGCLQRGQCY